MLLVRLPGVWLGEQNRCEGQMGGPGAEQTAL